MKLKEYLAKENVTLYDVAEHVGVSKQHIWMISNRRANPSASLAHQISLFTNGNVPVYEIRSCTKTCMPGCPCSKKDK